MALNAAQLAQRAGKLTASRVACLMEGDAQKIYELWEEMVGNRIPEDLTRVWAVRRGENSEPLNLEWFDWKQSPISRVGEVVTHPRHPWACCTLDAWCEQLQCPIECKDVGGREPIEVIIDRYQPQMQWQMECTGAKQCALSVIIAGAEPIVQFIEADAVYQSQMVLRGRQFMRHVAERTSPVALPPVLAPVDASQVYDMTGNNEWAAHAGTWLDTWDHARIHDDTAKILKGMVPADAKKCSGHGVRITRNRIGNLSLREDREDVR